MYVCVCVYIHTHTHTHTHTYRGVCVSRMTELANFKYAQGLKGKCENNERNKSYETFTRWA